MKNYKVIAAAVFILSAGLVFAGNNDSKLNYCLDMIKANDGTGQGKANDGTGQGKANDGTGQGKANDGTGQGKANDGTGQSAYYDALVACLYKGQ